MCKAVGYRRGRHECLVVLEELCDLISILFVTSNPMLRPCGDSGYSSDTEFGDLQDFQERVIDWRVDAINVPAWRSMLMVEHQMTSLLPHLFPTSSCCLGRAFILSL
jgi:hypothetical protein